MKRLFSKISFLFSRETYSVDNFQKLLPYLIPEYWASNRKSFILFWLIGSFTVVFVIWASFAEVNQVVRASGTVVPDSKVHLIQSGIAGPIEEININDDSNNIDMFLLNKEQINKANEEYRLRRNKPLPDSKNTLESCINLNVL